MHESASIQPQTEHNQSTVMPVRFFSIRLPNDLPIQMHYPHEHGDAPIQMLHVHACWELGYCFEGSGIFVIGSKVLSFDSGAVSLIGPNEPHFARSLAGTTSRWAWVYLDPLQLAGGLDTDLRHLDPSMLHGTTFTNIVTSEESGTLSEAMRQLVSELQRKQADHDVMVRALVCQIMLLYRRLQPQNIKMDGKVSPCVGGLMQRLAPALEYLASHYQDHLDVPSLADRCALSESHFRRLFGDALGMAPQIYWQHLRIRMSASLLRSNEASILQISQQVGFDSLSSFNRQFKQIMGITPRQWRSGAQSQID